MRKGENGFADYKPKGGQRKGAGRPRLYSEPSKQIRVPASMVDQIKKFAQRMDAVEKGVPLCLTNSDMAKILRAVDIVNFQIGRTSNYDWEVLSNPLPTILQQSKVSGHPYLEGQSVKFGKLR